MEMKLSVNLPEVVLEGSMSQIFDIGPSFYYVKNRVTFYHFFQFQFLHFIKFKLGPK